MNKGSVYQWQTVSNHGARDSHWQVVGSTPTSPTCRLCGKNLVIKQGIFGACPKTVNAPIDGRVYFSLFSGHDFGIILFSRKKLAEMKEGK